MQIWLIELLKAVIIYVIIYKRIKKMKIKVKNRV